jgi:hypothetical protein
VGYWTYYSGEVEYELDEIYVKILQSWIHLRLGENPSFTFGPLKLEVQDEWKNHNYLMEDILLFIEKYGKVVSGNIYCSGEESYDVKEIEAVNGEFYEFPYEFLADKTEKKHISLLNDFVEKHEYLSNYDVTYSDANDEVELKVDEIIQSFIDGELGDVGENVGTIMEFLKKGYISSFVFMFDDEKISLSDDDLKHFIVTPFLRSNEAKRIAPLKLPFLPVTFLTDFDVDSFEKRLIKVGENVFPLFEPFMSVHYDNKVYSHDSWVSPCEFCQNRLESITGKCNPCTPKKAI